MARGQGSSVTDILYGRSGPRGAAGVMASIEDLCAELHQQFDQAFASSDQLTAFDDHRIEAYSLFDLLRQLDRQGYYFDKPDPLLHEVPALKLQAAFSWERLHQFYPKIERGQDLEYAERFISLYARGLGFRLIGARDPANGYITGLSGSVLEQGYGFSMDFPLIADRLDLSEVGVHPVDFL